MDANYPKKVHIDWKNTVVTIDDLGGYVVESDLDYELDEAEASPELRWGLTTLQRMIVGHALGGVDVNGDTYMSGIAEVEQELADKERAKVMTATLGMGC